MDEMIIMITSIVFGIYVGGILYDIIMIYKYEKELREDNKKGEQ